MPDYLEMTSLDNNLLAVGLLNTVDSIKIYNLTSGTLKYILNNDTAPFYQTVEKFVELDNNLLASMVITRDSYFYYNTSIHVWNLTSGKLIYTLNESNRALDLVAFENKFLVTALNTSVKIWNMSDGSLNKVLVNTTIDAYCYVLASLENNLVAGGFSNGSIIVWNVTTGNFIFNLITNSPFGNTDSVYKIVLLDNSSIVSSTYNGKINVWNITSGTLKYSFDNGLYFQSCFSYLGDHLLASCTSDNLIKIWNLLTGTLMITLYGNNDGSYINSIILFNKSFLIGGSSDSSIKFWDITTGTLEYTLTYRNGGHYGPVKKLVLLTNDSFASLAYDQTVKIWQLNGRSCFS